MHLFGGLVGVKELQEPSAGTSGLADRGAGMLVSLPRSIALPIRSKG